MSDTLATLGTILDETAARDAIHVAVATVMAACKLSPGAHIGVCDGQAGTHHLPFIGIVDPFLERSVQVGEIFWIFIYPRTVTSMRHLWTLPALPDSRQTLTVDGVHTAQEWKDISEKWLRDFIRTADCPSYDIVIEAATGNYRSEDGKCYSNNDGDYIMFMNLNAHGDIPPEFWTHIEIVTGKSIPTNRRASYFTCSC
jgi:hypothetical protein